MTTMDGTVPRPPAATPGDPRIAIHVTAAWAMTLTIVALVAIPTAVAWVLGFGARCAAIIAASAAEAYAAGRGPRG